MKLCVVILRDVLGCNFGWSIMKKFEKTDGKDEHNTLKEKDMQKKNATQLICSKGLVYQNVAWATL